MKFFKFSLVCALLLLLASPSYAIDEEVLKQKIVKNLEKIVANAKIQEPTINTPTRSQAGPRLYRQVVNAVVYIVTAEGGEGSGIIISSKGLIITNWHVVGSEPFVGVIFKPVTPSGKISISKKDIFFARILKTDPLRDLALLELASPYHPGITSVRFGHLSLVEVGQDVFAISHPERLLWSYTEGVISQIRPKEEWKSDIGTVHKATLIQTQTVISFGSSGAPLFDTEGRLIGILTSTVGPGLNFAIAIDEVQQFILAALEKR